MKTLRDQLKEWRRQNMPQKKKHKKQPQKPSGEKLKYRDILDLMGVHRPVYERRGGAIRQK
ncbi:hypothetical protein [Fictibacillus gelatini]|uniref:hypothetical protein n=1 Tax=Fictibacillus gelatini TaxID=225985 RepID=UPI0004798F77|nr:hypothetical protein [Fictibacillus gelatini]